MKYQPLDHLWRLLIFNRNGFEFQLHLFKPGMMQFYKSYQKLNPFNYLRLICYLDGNDIAYTPYDSWLEMIKFAVTGNPNEQLKEIIENQDF